MPTAFSCLTLIAVASLVVIAAASIEHSENDTAETTYAIVLSVISFLFCIPLLALAARSPALLEKDIAGGTVGLICAVCMSLWWLPGTGVLTYRDPFTFLGNGYFGAWAGLVGSLAWLASIVGTGGIENTQRGPMIGLIVSSIALLIACVDHDEEKDPETSFGIALSVVTAVLAAGMLFLSPLKPIVLKACAALLVPLWIAGAGVLTFKDPFKAAGNGYFSSWAGLFFAFATALDAFNLRSMTVASAESPHKPQ
uniref:Ammonium transporter AmtB-like domain-containing protein n=1 Tax=Chrysotila carterae TaxID=13221 RepID=A0A7S4BHK4_CHRCT|mmetsp:Transcript_12152/g.26235  ORF Transcript_12152/g.26235 Transcript_12152/m.26235 type:complete len:254 (-) Transcript_12152:557-1318(-)